MDSGRAGGEEEQEQRHGWSVGRDRSRVGGRNERKGHP